MCPDVFRIHLQEKDDRMSGRYDETLCCCALNMIFGYEPKISHALVETLGSAAAVFSLDREGLDTVFGPYSVHRSRISPKALDDASRELEKAASAGCVFIGCTDGDYPALLRECPDAPAGIYVRSSLRPADILGKRRMLSVVGTRDVSDYGREWTMRVVSSMSSVTPEPPVIVSGLAYGVDFIAHRQALDSGLLTIAVMATGPDSVYPSRHASIADEIASHGALVTDFPVGTSPLKVNFIRRNRIIAGLSSSVILMESRMKGGGMVTAGLAMSYDRNVYALPGRIDDDRSRGCNWLIRSRSAEPVFSLEDLAAGMGLRMGEGVQRKIPEDYVREVFAGRLDSRKIGDLAAVISAVRRNRGITVDELAVMLGRPWKETREYVAMLEQDGMLAVDIMQRCSICVGRQ